MPDHAQGLPASLPPTSTRLWKPMRPGVPVVEGRGGSQGVGVSCSLSQRCGIAGEGEGQHSFQYLYPCFRVEACRGPWALESQDRVRSLTLPPPSPHEANHRSQSLHHEEGVNQCPGGSFECFPTTAPACAPACAHLGLSEDTQSPGAPLHSGQGPS